MAFSTDHAGDALFEDINRPFRDLPDLLDTALRALAERTHTVAGALHVHGVGIATVWRAGGRIASAWSDGDGCDQDGHGVDRSDRDHPGQATVALPIAYAGTVLGALRLRLRPAPAPGGPCRTLLDHFAYHCALLVKRYEVRRWSEQRLGRPMLLVGLSTALRELEALLEVSAQATLPVVLRGEFGTEKAQFAAAIHCCGPLRDGPFVQIDCTEPAGAPERWIEQAAGGTLFLSDIDELEPRLQKQLPQLLPSRLHRWLPRTRSGAVRVIASTTGDLHQRADQGLFSRSLLAELDFLAATVPPLRERRGDIEPLIWQALDSNGHRGADKRSEALVAACNAYGWPENLFELERVVARLAALTGARPIEGGDIRRHAPRLAGLTTGRDRDDRTPLAGDRADRWVRCATEGDGLPGIHEALRRAVAHLGAHYEQPVSLDQLARRASVSPSHLSYLFRTDVGMPFRSLLARIRIHKARELLAGAEATSITEVALRVGFADLSHFERSFRRIVGESPRDFRRRAGSRHAHDHSF